LKCDANATSGAPGGCLG